MYNNNVPSPLSVLGGTVRACTGKVRIEASVYILHFPLSFRLFLEKLPKLYPDYNKPEYRVDRAKIKKLVKEAFPRAEELKRKLLKWFEAEKEVLEEKLAQEVCVLFVLYNLHLDHSSRPLLCPDPSELSLPSSSPRCLSSSPSSPLSLPFPLSLPPCPLPFPPSLPPSPSPSPSLSPSLSLSLSLPPSLSNRPRLDVGRRKGGELQSRDRERRQRKDCGKGRRRGREKRPREWLLFLPVEVRCRQT